MKLQTNNLDIRSMVSRMDRFIKEVIACQSGNGNAVMIHDLNRLKSYLAACVAIKAHYEAEPILDLPEWHPTVLDIDLVDMTLIDAIENEALKDWARLMHIGAFELANSQSSRQSTSFIGHDSARINAIFGKLNNYITNYIETILPEDLPETTPSFASVKPGATGISK